MKAYVLVTGVVWLLILAAHVARLFAEGSHVLTEPAFLGSSLLCLGLLGWACRVFRRLSTKRADETALPIPPGAAK